MHWNIAFPCVNGNQNVFCFVLYVNLWWEFSPSWVRREESHPTKTHNIRHMKNQGRIIYRGFFFFFKSTVGSCPRAQGKAHSHNPWLVKPLFSWQCQGWNSTSPKPRLEKDKAKNRVISLKAVIDFFLVLVLLELPKMGRGREEVYKSPGWCHCWVALTWSLVSPLFSYSWASCAGFTWKTVVHNTVVTELPLSIYLLSIVHKTHDLIKIATLILRAWLFLRFVFYLHYTLSKT